MKRSGLLALTLVLLAALPQAQTSPAPSLADYAGTWKAEFHKQTWLVLTLTLTKTLADGRYPGEVLSGTLTHSTEISADDEGDITRVGDDMSTDHIVEVELHGDTLRISTRDEEGNADEYVLTLTGKDTADLQPVTASGSAAPRPFHLKRALTDKK